VVNTEEEAESTPMNKDQNQGSDSEEYAPMETTEELTTTTGVRRGTLIREQSTLESWSMVNVGPNKKLKTVLFKVSSPADRA